MRATVLLLVGVVCGAGAGCRTPAYPEPGCGTLYEDVVRNVTEAPVRGGDDAHLKLQLRRLARRAWDDYAAHSPSPPSADFGEGFRTGFADYLYEGPPGQPPAVPPFPYQLRRYATVEGHAAIEQWYAGFAAGAEAAKASGLRDLIVIPLGQPPINAVDPRLDGPRPAPSPAAPAPGPPPVEVLPPPRPADAPEAAPPPGGE
jgi:hypothetical protein